jgi:hypothetical protein
VLAIHAILIVTLLTSAPAPSHRHLRIDLLAFGFAMAQASTMMARALKRALAAGIVKARRIEVAAPV